jgi:DnaK suppressor protein
MNRKALEKYRVLLEDKRRALREQAARNLGQIRWTTESSGGRDAADEAAENSDRAFLFALSALERETLQLIDEALERVEDGSYGYCLMSGEPIGDARLKAIPWARYTVECQAEIEREEAFARRARGLETSGSMAS